MSDRLLVFITTLIGLTLGRLIRSYIQKDIISIDVILLLGLVFIILIITEIKKIRQ